MSNVVPNLWEERPFSELITRHNSGIYKKKELYGTGLNIAGVSDLYGSIFVNGREYRRVPLNAAEIKKHTLEEGDLLYGESSLVRSGIARTVCVTKKGEGTAFAWHTRRLKIDRSIADSVFLAYLLEDVGTRLKVEAVATQTALTGMTTKDYFSVKLLLPPLSEQQKIASILSSIDDLIEKTQAKIDKRKNLKIGMMHELLTKGVGHTEFKDSPVGRIPVKWNIARFSDVFEDYRYGPRFSSKDYNKKGNVRTIRGTDVESNGEVNYQQVPIAKIDERTVEAHALKDGDLVMITTADCGVSAVFREQTMPYIASAYAIKLSPSNKIQPQFIKFFMQTPLAMKQIESFIRKGTVANLPGSDVMQLKLAIPPIDEQKKIASILIALDSEIEKTQDKLEAVKNTKQALMQDLLTGKVRVKVDQ